MPKPKLNKEEGERPSSSGGQYFYSQTKDVEFFTSGCALLDCVLGGGWPVGRITNIIGDKSTGKTLLCIEAAANFAKKYPDSPILYREAESAFDKGYAKALGLPIDRIDFGDEDEEEPLIAVEDIFEDLEFFLENHPANTPALYIIDSLDALSDRAELDRDIDKGSYGAEKAKKMSQLFRRLVKRMGKKKVTVMIVSQIRDNIGAFMGEKYTRSGGHAMDFYASQCLWLYQTGREKVTKKKIERTIGVKIKAQCKKNKVALPYRECNFPILFGYGIEDVKAHLGFIKEVNAWNRVPKTVEILGEDIKGLDRKLEKISDKDYQKMRKELRKIVPKIWNEIESDFIVSRRKY